MAHDILHDQTEPLARLKVIHSEAASTDTDPPLLGAVLAEMFKARGWTPPTAVNCTELAAEPGCTEMPSIVRARAEPRPSRVPAAMRRA